MSTVFIAGLAITGAITSVVIVYQERKLDKKIEEALKA